MKRFLLSIFLLPLFLSAQVQMNGAGSYTQDFNTLANTGSVNPWVNNSTIANWFSQRTTPGTNYNIGTGSLTTGDMYSFGASGSTERALGCLGSQNTQTGGSFAHGILLQNAGSSTVGSFNVSYALEQWRNGGSNTAQSVTVWYKVSSSAISSVTPTVTTGWTQVTALTGTSSQTSATAGALDGNAAANRAVITGVVPTTVPAGSYVMIKWEDPDHAGNDDGFGLDDFSVSWSTCTPTFGTDVLTTCDSLAWIDGNTYTTTTNTATFNLLNSTGCDSIVTLDLTVNYSSSSYLLEEVCALPYTSPNTGQTYTTAGILTTVTTNANGCPNVDTIEVSVIPTIFSTLIDMDPNTSVLFTPDSSIMTGYQWIDCTTGLAISGQTSATFAPDVNGTYSLIGEWPYNCVDTSSCYTTFGVSLNEINNSLLSVQPNPSNGSFELNLPSKNQSARIEIFDLNGQIMFSEVTEETNYKIELPKIAKGTYILNAQTESTVYSTRIVIE